MVRPKSDAFTGIIDRILDAYKLVSKTQRHTSKWVFERLRDAYGIGGGMVIPPFVGLFETRITRPICTVSVS